MIDSRSKTLTIAIPTWNRALLLKELLQSLVEEILNGELQNRVEIFISDNGSIDTTEEVVRNFQSRYPFILYNNNGRNKGARYNLLFCMENANSEFQIVLGDDDRISRGSIHRTVKYLELNRNIGFLFDRHRFKINNFSDTNIKLDDLVRYFYYNVGNAGVFILRTKIVREVLKSWQYENLSPSWPQTQIIILGAIAFRDSDIHIVDLAIQAEGRHQDVMIYTSYYLWRTTYIDLVIALYEIREHIPKSTFDSAQDYFKKNLRQNIFNILQCGVYLDSFTIRMKTCKDILMKNNMLSQQEKLGLLLVCTVFVLPTLISRTMSNIFIIFTRGSVGLEKKNIFVHHEMTKRLKMKSSKSKIIREFDFTNV